MNQKNNVDYNIKLFPVDNWKNYHINYLVKFAGSSQRSGIPSKSFIATQNEKQIIKEYYDPKIGNDNSIDLVITNISTTFSYIQIIAQIIDKEVVEFLSYDIFNLRSEIDPDDQIRPNEPKDFAYKKLYQYIFVIPSDNNKNYLKLEVIGENPKINYVTSVYLDSTRKKRSQLGQSLNGNTKLYLAIKNIQILYIDLECYSECSGTIENELSAIITLDEGDSINYYVSDINKEMKFSINSNSEISNVWARGQSNIQTKFTNLDTI